MAIEEAEKVLKDFPKNVKAWIILGNAHLYKKDFSKAKKAFEEVVRLAPGTDNAKLAQQYLEFLKKSGK